MSTSSELKAREISSRESIADKDRAQKEKSDKRSARASFYGNAVKSIASVMGKMNDPSWYKQLDNTDQVNAVPTNFQILDVPEAGIRTLFDSPSPAVPSVIRINYGPTLGNQDTIQLGEKVLLGAPYADSVNIALNRVCTQLEMRNSRVLSYSRDTIGRYIFIATDVAANLLRLKSALDVYTMAEATKPYISKMLIKALGFDYDDFKTNVSAYKSFYVAITHEFNQSVPLPADLAYVKRQLWLSHTLVKDMKSEYCTYLVFNRAIMFNFPNSGVLATNKPDNYVASRLPDKGFSFALFTLQYSQIISALANGATWRPLIRDLRGGTRSESWLQIPSDALKPTINVTDYDEVRNQIHNMDSLPCDISFSYSKCNKFGLSVSAFSVGGNVEERVVQNALCGSQGDGSPTTASVLASIKPGSFIAYDTVTANTTAVYNQWNDIFSEMFNGWINSTHSPLVKVYNQFDKYTPDSVLVGTRLSALFATRKTSVTIAAGDSQFSIKLENDSIIPSTTGNHYFALLEPVVYGTELVLSYQSISQDDGGSGDYNKYTTALTAWIGNGVLIDRDGFIGSTYFGYGYDEDNYADMPIIYICGIIGCMTTIDWTPRIRFVYQNQDGDKSLFTYGELDHYTILTASDLCKLESQCIQSEFTLPVNSYLKALS